MKYSKLATLGLIGALTLSIVGCSNNKAEVVPETPKEEITQQQNMTKDMYRDEFGKLYESNIARLENYNGYEKIIVEKETKDYPGNEKYLTDLKAAYADSEANLQAFVDSLKNMKTDDKEVQDMNDKLIAEGNKLIEDIKMKNMKLEKVPNELLTKSEIEFKKGLNDLIIVKDNTEIGFNKMLKDFRNSLGIK